MEKVFATYRNGAIILDQIVNWPEGTRLQLEPQATNSVQHMVQEFGICEEEWPATSEQRESWLNWLMSLEPLELSSEEMRRIETDRQEAKRRNIDNTHQQWTEVENLF